MGVDRSEKQTNIRRIPFFCLRHFFFSFFQISTVEWGLFSCSPKLFELASFHFNNKIMRELPVFLFEYINDTYKSELYFPFCFVYSPFYWKAEKSGAIGSYSRRLTGVSYSFFRPAICQRLSLKYISLFFI